MSKRISLTSTYIISVTSGIPTLILDDWNSIEFCHLILKPTRIFLLLLTLDEFGCLFEIRFEMAAKERDKIPAHRPFLMILQIKDLNQKHSITSAGSVHAYK